jgi:5-methylcytosine-specific restriction endonuclease McrA
MNFTIISNIELHARMIRLARTERKLTHHILLHINEVESRHLHLELGFGSMIDYLTKALGYSEGSAYRRLQSARLLKANPIIAAKIEDGSLNLSQLTQVLRHIRAEKVQGHEIKTELVREILCKIENKNTFQTSQELAIAFDVPVKEQEILQPQKDKSVRMEFTFTEEQFETLKQAREYLSHVTHENSWTDVISELANKFVSAKKGRAICLTEKNRTITNTNCLSSKGDSESSTSNGNSNGKMTSNEESNFRADKLISEGTSVNNCEQDLGSNNLTSCATAAESRDVSDNSQSREQSKNKSKKFQAARHRKYIPVTTKRVLLKKANHKCEYVNPENHQRCSSSYQLQLDHIWPIALGGDDRTENIRILCASHNKFEALRRGLLR